MGMLMLPFLGFSQQEQPKRVTVVVTAKEIAPQKEVVQLPADNVPASVNSKPKATLNKKTTYTTTKTIVPAKVQPEKTVAPSTKVASTPKTKSNVVAKENTIAKTRAKPNSTPKPITPPTIKKEEVIAKTKPAVKVEKEQIKPEKEIAAPAPITRAALPSNNKLETTTAPSKEEAIVKTESNKNNPQLSPDGQTNSTSYIWIGVFLIIAGVVLGLLFGKPAFLISFVGVVFVALGVII